MDPQAEDGQDEEDEPYEPEEFVPPPNWCGTPGPPFDWPEPYDPGWPALGGGGSSEGPFGQRRVGERSRDAIEAGLRWLAAHQSPNGGWEADSFGVWCDGRPVSDEAARPTGGGRILYDPGVTGLALCAFLGAGYSNRGQHPFARTVSRGLRYLKAIQDPEGCFGPRSAPRYVYNHAAAALAMVEAYGMTGSPIFKGAAQRALDFIALARNPYRAWRYGIKPGDNDTSVSGWMMMPLFSARWINEHALRRGHRPAPLALDPSALDGLKAWLDEATEPTTGRVGYMQRGSGPTRPPERAELFPAARSEAMTAVGVLARCLMGEEAKEDPLIRLGADRIAALPPRWNLEDGSIDMTYWHFATLAMFQVGGSHWKAWARSLQEALGASRRTDTDACGYEGSWDPVGPWGAEGGRVYATAVMVLCLEAPTRYDRVHRSR